MPGYNRSRRNRGRGRARRAQQAPEEPVVVQATYVTGEMGGGDTPILNAELVLRDYPTDFMSASDEIESWCPGFAWDRALNGDTADASLETENWCVQFSIGRELLQHLELPDDCYVRRFSEDEETLADLEKGTLTITWHCLGFINRLPLRDFKEQCMIIGIKIVEGMPGPNVIFESYGVPRQMDTKGKLTNCVANMCAYYFARGYKLIHFGNDFHTFYMAVNRFEISPEHPIIETLGYEDWVSPRMDCYGHFYGDLYEQWQADCEAEDCCIHCDITRWTNLWLNGYWKDTGSLYPKWQEHMKWHDKHQQQMKRFAGDLQLDRDYSAHGRQNLPVSVPASVNPSIEDCNKVKEYWTNSAKKSAQWEHMKWFHTEYEIRARRYRGGDSDTGVRREPRIQVFNGAGMSEQQIGDLLSMLLGSSGRTGR